MPISTRRVSKVTCSWNTGIPKQSLTVEGQQGQHPQIIPEQMTHQKNLPNQTLHNISTLSLRVISTSGCFN